MSERKLGKDVISRRAATRNLIEKKMVKNFSLSLPKGLK